MHRSAEPRAAALLASTILGAPAHGPDRRHTPPANPPLAEGGFATSDATDPYLWLEEVDGERAMAWVNAHNARSLGVLQGDPRYEPPAPAGAGDRPGRATASPRPASPTTARSTISGRTPTTCAASGARTTLDSYRTDAPQWETILDLDALSDGRGQELGLQGRRPACRRTSACA